MAGTGYFQVGPNGFTDPNGNAWNPKGVDVDAGLAQQMLPIIQSQLPGTNFVRLVANGNSDTGASLQPIVDAYTKAGIVVELEDHWDTNNPAVYTDWANTFKGNNHVFLETQNEPTGDVTGNQVATINAIRSAGWQNPIGVQPTGGYDFSNVGPTIAQTGTAQLYVTPHMYDSSTDPNDAQNYINADLAGAKAVGLYPVFDEFGDSMTGSAPVDPNGDITDKDMVATQQSGQAGAAFWSATNGFHMGDNVWLAQDGSQMTPEGQNIIAPWLSGAAPAGGSTTPAGTPAPAPAPSQAQQNPAPAPAPAAGAGTPNTATPGQGDVKLGSTDYTIDANGNVLAGGSAVPGGDNTAEIAGVSNTLYGEDATTHNWYTFDGTSWNAASAPQLGGAPAPQPAPAPAPAPAPQPQPAPAPAPAPQPQPTGGPTPFTAPQTATLNAMAGANDPGSAHLLASLYQGQFVGDDLKAAGAAAGKPSAAQVQTTAHDLVGMLTNYVQGGASGSAIGLRPDFETAVVKDAIVAQQSGNPALQQAFGSAMVSFFGSEAGALQHIGPLHAG